MIDTDALRKLILEDGVCFGGCCGGPQEVLDALDEIDRLQTENAKLREAMTEQTRLHAEWRENFRRTHRPRSLDD